MASVKSGNSLLAVKMDGKLEQALKKAIIEWFTERGDLDGNPFDVYARHIGIGERTFKRRLKGQEPWIDWELVRINADLRNEKLQNLLKTRYDWATF